jgi:hypothetical protein
LINAGLIGVCSVIEEKAGFPIASVGSKYHSFHTFFFVRLDIFIFNKTVPSG